MTKKTYISPLSLAVFDFFLLNISFFTMNYWKRGTLQLSPQYVKLLIAFCVIWLFISLVTRKFHFDFSRSYRDMLSVFTRSTIFVVYCVSLMVVIMGLGGFSRLQVFGTCGLLFFLELVILSIYHLGIIKKKITQTATDVAKLKPKLLTFLSVSDFLLVTFLFFLMNFLKKGTVELSPEYEKLLLAIYGLWFLTAVITRKFDTHSFRNYYYVMAQWVKAVILMGLSGFPNTNLTNNYY